MLQISDFFQCKEAITLCIQNLEIKKENALLNIKEALKKIQNCQKQNGHCKECWFSLIQKSIAVAASHLHKSHTEMEALKELNNKYVTKEVIERYFRL